MIASIVSQQKKQRRELEKELKIIHEHPSLRNFVIFHERKNQRVETVVDREEKVKSEIEYLSTTIEQAKTTQETILRQLFTEQFYDQLYLFAKKRDVKIPNDKLRSSIDRLVAAKQEEYERIKTIAAMFE